MKKFSFFSLAVAGLLLGSCSNDEILDGGNPGANGSGTAVATAGYINLGINLPTSPKAVKVNDEFNDGDASEYAVNNAILVVLQKGASATDDDATVLAAYDLSDLKPWPEVGTATDQITSKATIVTAVPEATEGNDRYALVMLNAENLFDVTADNELVRKNSIDDAAFSTTALTTFADINAAYAASTTVPATPAGTDQINSKVGFFMSNAPLADASTGANIQTLVPLEDKIYSTEEEARQNEAANVYVERAVSKVTFTSDFNGVIAAEPGAAGNANYVGDSVIIVSWDLDITNRAFYPVRKTNAALWNTITTNGGRFYGTMPVDGEADAKLYRTYWGEDPNYSAYVGSAFNVAPSVKSADFVGLDAGAVRYCLENTFDIANQNRDQTTRLLFKAVYVPKNFVRGGNFYTLNSGTELYYENEIAHLEGLDWWTDEPLTNVIPPAENTIDNIVLQEMLSNDAFADAHGLFDKSQVTGLDYNFTAGANDLSKAEIVYTTYSYKASDDAEAEFISEEDYDDYVAAGEQAKVTKKEDNKLGAAALATLSQAIGTINCYQSGLSYYDAYIRHFNDTEIGTLPDAFENDYGTDNASYLGRYGLLRNNWYQLNVRSISGPGESDVPERPSTTDDQKKSYVAMTVNVLSWALRQQNVDL